MTDATNPAGDPIGWLCRTKQQVIDAEKAFPGESHDYLWKYTHGTKDMERFAAFPDLDVMPLYASPAPFSGMTAALADRERAIAEAVAGEREACASACRKLYFKRGCIANGLDCEDAIRARSGAKG